MKVGFFLIFLNLIAAYTAAAPLSECHNKFIVRICLHSKLYPSNDLFFAVVPEAKEANITVRILASVFCANHSGVPALNKVNNGH